VPGLLDPPPLDLGEASRRVRELRRRARELFRLGGLLTAAGAALVALDPGGLGIPLLIGAAAAFALCALQRSDRTRLLVRLIAQGDAWMVDGVQELADRLLSARERSRLADGLRAAAETAELGAQTAMMVSPARVDPIAERLLRLADKVADPTVRLTAPAAALCRRLLCDAMYSPLYNPHVPERELPRVLDLVEDGCIAA
jgi:hypothetical protein